MHLPFIGRDKLEMIVPYEAESLLPFSLEDAINNIADLYSMTQTLIKDSVDQHRRAQ